MQPAARREADERLVPDLLQADRAAARQRPARRRDQDDLFGHQRFRGECRGQIGMDRPEDQVEIARGQVVEELADQAGTESECHPGVPVVEEREQPRQVDGGQPLGGADP